MPQSRAHEFIDALHRLENDRDAEAIVSLFGEDAELDNPTHETPLHGRDGTRKFWEVYRKTFGDIHSDFHHVLEDDGSALLEWTSRGTVPDGTSIHYNGVTVLEYDDEGIHHFRAYFDPGDLGEQIEEKSGR